MPIVWSAKGFYPKYINSSYNLTSKKPNNPIKNWEEDLNRYFAKEEVQMTNRHIKRCSTLLMREMQIKTTMRHHITPVSVAVIKTKQNINYTCWWGYGENIIYVFHFPIWFFFGSWWRPWIWYNKILKLFFFFF